MVKYDVRILFVGSEPREVIKLATNNVLSTAKNIATTILLLSGILVFALATLGAAVPALASVFGFGIEGLGFIGGVGFLAIVAIAAAVLNEWVP